MFFPLAAYFIRSWRWLVLTNALTGLLFIPESPRPRRLLSQGRIAEAEAILRHAAKQNKLTAPEVIFTASEIEEAAKMREKKHNILDILRNCNAVLTIFTSVDGHHHVLLCSHSEQHKPSWKSVPEFLPVCSGGDPSFHYSHAVAQILQQEILSVLHSSHGWSYDFHHTAHSQSCLWVCLCLSRPDGVGNLTGDAGKAWCHSCILCSLCSDFRTVSYRGEKHGHGNVLHDRSHRQYSFSLHHILGLAVFSGSITLLLPETKGKVLPETIAQMQ